MGDGIVGVPIGTLCAHSINTIEPGHAIALQGSLIKDLIGVAAVAVEIGATCDFCWWLAMEAILGDSSYD